MFKDNSCSQDKSWRISHQKYVEVICIQTCGKLANLCLENLDRSNKFKELIFFICLNGLDLVEGFGRCECSWPVPRCGHGDPGWYKVGLSQWQAGLVAPNESYGLIYLPWTIGNQGVESNLTLQRPPLYVVCRWSVCACFHVIWYE